MSKTVETLSAIGNVGSTKKKGEILTKNMDEYIHLALNLALSTRIRFGVKLENVSFHPEVTPRYFEEVLEYIEQTRPFTNNKRKAALVEWISGVSDDVERDFLVRIINKDLNIGIASSTTNKAIRDSGTGLPDIQVLLPMKAKKEKDVDIDRFLAETSADSEVFSQTVHVQTKVDAARAYIVVNLRDDEAYILSSSGHRMDMFTHLNESAKFGCRLWCKRIGRNLFDTDVEEDPTQRAFIFDGELVAANDDGTLMTRQKSNGLFNKAVRGTIKETEVNRFRFITWDFIHSDVDDPELPLYHSPLDSPEKFKNVIAEGQKRYIDGRHFDLSVITKFLREDEDSLIPHQIIMVDGALASSKKEIYRISDSLISKGEEGAIVKRDHVYEPKRSSNLVKIKKAYMADVRVTGVNEGKNKGTLGSLSYETDDGRIAGDFSGISDDLKALWWESPERIIGSVVEVRYMEVTTDKNTGKWTLYGPPVFVRVRSDKEETSTFEELS